MMCAAPLRYDAAQDAAQDAAGKAVVRARARQIRSGIGTLARTRASAAVCAHLLDLVAAHGAASIGVYAATPLEVDVDAAVRAWLSAGLVVAYPRVEGPTAMTFRAVMAVPEVPRGPLSLREPDAGDPVVDDLDLLVVPGLAFDRGGRRLGHGRGFYDRWLHAHPGSGGRLTVGVCTSGQVIDEVPVEDHDVPLDLILTEAGVIGGTRPAAGGVGPVPEGLS